MVCFSRAIALSSPVGFLRPFQDEKMVGGITAVSLNPRHGKYVGKVHHILTVKKACGLNSLIALFSKLGSATLSKPGWEKNTCKYRCQGGFYGEGNDQCSPSVYWFAHWVPGLQLCMAVYILKGRTTTVVSNLALEAILHFTQ